ncbi:hypothetical protein [Citrobacter sp. RHB25-C09]|nr:hypothetical protein [Citrobacter sp. RHB25-C09]QMI05523.1 hypothetical protein HVY19_11870 [Citrobacter sp. RHB25-C09]
MMTPRLHLLPDGGYTLSGLQIDTWSVNRNRRPGRDGATGHVTARCLLAA